MTNKEENIEEPIMNYSGNSGALHIFIPLLVLFILLLGFIGYLVVSPGPISDFKPPVDNNTQYLIDTNPQSTNNTPFVISKWILVLLATFGALQMFPILFASQKAKSGCLSQRERREIIFLCEMPMYLGLLGSLLGVCLTQFMTGSLSAPLAYITTISGILLHLFAKFTIIVPLPDTSTPGFVEEV
ncbi:hypothetical protein [Candidatus Scalindua japonica]|uniref:hypothetical protein n=1 Tax=Candidatus Scalindua japonica TaxID=1284222 RepID=UPI000BDF4E96|nr:hypothetical protein [Candidatus Scalindua japonica]